jgi:hypothetical protein
MNGKHENARLSKARRLLMDQKLKMSKTDLLVELNDRIEKGQEPWGVRESSERAVHASGELRT